MIYSYLRDIPITSLSIDGDTIILRDSVYNMYTITCKNVIPTYISLVKSIAMYIWNNISRYIDVNHIDHIHTDDGMIYVHMKDISNDIAATSSTIFDIDPIGNIYLITIYHNAYEDVIKELVYLMK